MHDALISMHGFSRTVSKVHSCLSQLVLIGDEAALARCTLSAAFWGTSVMGARVQFVPTSYVEGLLLGSAGTRAYSC